MLEQKDIEMIAEIVERVVKPIKEDMRTMQSDVRGFQSDVRGLQTDVKGLQSDVKSIELTLENETNKGIQIIAEGHLDLNRKLNEALKIDNEKEMLKLRVNRLESELAKVKARLEEIA